MGQEKRLRRDSPGEGRVQDWSEMQFRLALLVFLLAPGFTDPPRNRSEPAPLRLSWGKPSSNLLILAFFWSLAKKTHNRMNDFWASLTSQVDPSVCMWISFYTAECVCQLWLSGSVHFSASICSPTGTHKQLPNGLIKAMSRNFCTE